MRLCAYSLNDQKHDNIENLYCSASEFCYPVNFVTCHLNPQKPAILVFKYM